MFTLFLITFFDLLGFGIILPMIPVIVHNYKLNAIEVGMLVSSFFVGNLIGSFVLGYISDIWDRKKTIILSLIGIIICYICMGIVQVISTSLILLLIFRGLSGFFSGNMAVTFATASNLSTKKNLTKNMGIIGSAITLGIIFGPTLGGYLSRDYNSVIPFYYTSVFYIICLILAILFLKPNKANSNKQKSHYKNILKSIPKLIFKRSTLLFIGIFIIFNFSFTGLEVFLITQTLSIHFHQNPLMLGMIWTYFAIILTIAQLFLSRALSVRIYIPLGLLLFGVSIFSLSFASNLWEVMIVITIISLSAGVIYPNITASLSLAGEQEQQGTVFGVNNSVQAIGGALGPYVLGYMYNVFNTIIVVWGSIAILLISASILTMIYYKTHNADLFKQ